MGEHDMDVTEGSEMTIAARRIVQHPSYISDEEYLYNDVALIELNSPVTFSNYIQPACLPASAAESFQDMTCYVSG